jgi:flagellar motility protein MotE (MotC chaperone)
MYSKTLLEKKRKNFSKSENQKRKREIKVLEQKLKGLNVKKDNLRGDLENNVISQKNNEIEENLTNSYFV